MFEHHVKRILIDPLYLTICLCSDNSEYKRVMDIYKGSYEEVRASKDNDILFKRLDSVFHYYSTSCVLNEDFTVKRKKQPSRKNNKHQRTEIDRKSYYMNIDNQH